MTTQQPESTFLSKMLTIVDGYRRHAEIMKSVVDEQHQDRSHGCLDPMDGFPATAASVAQHWRDRILEDIRDNDDVDLISVLASTVREFGRYYSEADLTWSSIWTVYQPQCDAWVNDLRSVAIEAYDQRQEFARILPALAERIK